MDFVELNCPSHPGVNQWAVSINNQAKAAGVPPCALAAIVANETGGRNVFQEGVAKGPGCGVGLCQITSGVDWTEPDAPTYHALGRTFALLDPSSNLFIAASKFLKPDIETLMYDRTKRRAAYARFSSEILFFALAAFNAGAGSVMYYVARGENPDDYTSNRYAERAMKFYHAFVLESAHG